MITEREFNKGFLFENYVRKLGSLRKITEEIYEKIKINEEIKENFNKKIDKYGELNIACITEPWCGDSACNLPIVKKLFENEKVHLRIFIRSLNPEIENKLYERGIKKIPTFIFFNENFEEISVWIERPKKADELIRKWKEEHPEFEKLKKSDKREDKLRLRELYNELINFMKGKYIDFLWKETAREILDSL